MSVLPTIFDLCVPQEDVLKGTVSDSDFAAKLSHVLTGRASPDYGDPSRFFTNTYPTEGLKELLANVCGRLSGRGGSVSAVFRLDTSFGGGKTHGLIALVHAAKSGRTVANIGEFVDATRLPDRTVRIAAIDGEDADPANGRLMGDGIRARTPWGEIAYQLAGKAGYEVIRRSDEEAIAPGADTIAELFGSAPVLIVLDEMGEYLRRVQHMGGRDQLTAFLKALFTAAEGNPHAAVVFTLAIRADGKGVDAFAEENEFLASAMAELESVSGRKATNLNPTRDDETEKVVRRRLFARIDDARAAEVVEAYHSLWVSERNELLEPPVTVTCKSADALDHIADNSVDAVVMDPPYGANVMYAELSDFFYVWLKRTAGLVMPELFTRYLTDKDAEAVANNAKFKGHKGAGAVANRDYQEKMTSIFGECRRILKANGIMTVMFMHKDAGAWDALTKGLIEAGFAITASWPVNTEAEGSLHIKDKAAANSTIFLVCRPRPGEDSSEVTYWEDVEPLVARAVRTRVEEFQNSGISGVDLYLASFGPALEEFSKHWPLKRGTPRPEPASKKRRKQAELFEEEFDPYAVTPEDALDAARREVKTWRLNKLTHLQGRADLDPITSWFVLAWDAFKAPVFAYDEGLRLSRAVGADLDRDIIGKLCEKKGSDLKLWDSITRSARAGLGPADGSRAIIDAIHHAAYRGRDRTVHAARDLLKDQHLLDDPGFLSALEAVLEVLPPSRTFIGYDAATGDAKSAADDFDALEKLRRLALSDKIDEPSQLELFVEEAV